MKPFFPRYFSSKAISLYTILLCICSILFYNKVLPYHWIVFGFIEVVGFFYFGNLFTKNWSNLSPDSFVKKLFRVALTIRIFYVLFSYYFYYWMTGSPFEFDTADAMGYHEEALWVLDLLSKKQLHIYWVYIKENYSDLGYVAYLTFIYSFLAKSVLLVRLIKAVLSAYTCVLIYKIAKRNFGNSVANIAGISSLLLPNFIYYCGLHLKETEMIFILVFFIERADYLLREKELKLFTLFTILLSGGALFFFRTVLGIAALLAFITAFTFSTNRYLGIRKKIGLGTIAVLFIILMSGGAISNEINSLLEQNKTNQSVSMQARAKRVSGNKLAVYGSAVVFAPFMLLGPFPTLVDIKTQQNQMLMNGGYFVRNVFVFFLFIGLITLVNMKQIKNHLLIIVFTFSYLVVIALSKFAISERFHFPVLPFIVILSSYGITELNTKNKQYYIPYLVLVFFIIVGWNYFKLAGRE